MANLVRSEKSRQIVTAREVAIFPRFSLGTAYKLNEAIKDIGIVTAFTQDADFSGMTDDPKGLMIESIVHKATIDVDEKGTVAAAATMMAGRLIGIPPPPPVFRADHPFMFLLRDVNTGTILFIGKLEVPRASGIQKTLESLG